MKKCIMAVGAHADDIEGNAGGTILKYRKLGYDLVYVMSTNNMSGSWQSVDAKGKVTSRAVPWYEMMPQRKLEAAKAGAFFNAPVFHLDHPQRHCRDREGVVHTVGYGTRAVDCVAANQDSILTAHESAEARKAVIDLVKRFEPEVVMTHGPIQIDMEHIGTSLLVTKALMECAYEGMVLLWPCVDDTPFNSAYNCRGSYVDISDYYEGKLETIKIHNCQMPSVAHLCWPSWEKGTGCKHVEAYAIVQEGKSGGALRAEILKNRSVK